MLVYRSVKGSNLTPTEVDNNFHDVDDRVTFIEENPPVAKSIDEITAEGGTLVILYTDSTEDVVTLPPVSLRGRGDWTTNTAYLINDTVQADGVVYVVIFNHTSAATGPMDPGANDGNGHDYYSPLFDIPELSLPPGGAEGFVLQQVGSDLEMQWTNAGIPPGGSTGEVLTKASSDDLDVEWTGASASAGVIVITGASVEINDSLYENKYLRCTNVGGCEVTFRADDVFNFDIGTEIHFRQCSNNQVEFVEGGDSDSTGEVMFNLPLGFSAATAIQGAVVTFKKVDAGEWDVFGLLAEASV